MKYRLTGSTDLQSKVVAVNAWRRFELSDYDARTELWRATKVVSLLLAIHGSGS